MLLPDICPEYLVPDILTQILSQISCPEYFVPDIVPDISCPPRDAWAATGELAFPAEAGSRSQANVAPLKKLKEEKLKSQMNKKADAKSATKPKNQY